ncbi:hypothetical protein M9194_02855 [Vibrio sp. S4M6]|nr:hypothetical protein [Vibrio sinus]MCL9780371.1 hypothetical protein [Vibrio sinus]
MKPSRDIITIGVDQNLDFGPSEPSHHQQSVDGNGQMQSSVMCADVDEISYPN